MRGRDGRRDAYSPGSAPRSKPAAVRPRADWVSTGWSTNAAAKSSNQRLSSRVCSDDDMSDAPNSRLETFCDGVFAIALTLLIIDIRIPAPDGIATTRELWLALKHLAPSALAFVLSFVIILITWVNHHSAFRLVHKSSAAFIYANGFLLLTVVVMPFPTALVGAYVLTDHAAPAVVIYNAVTAVQ